MKTKKISLYEFKSLIKNIIKEEYDNIDYMNDKSIMVKIDNFSEEYRKNFKIYEYFKNKYKNRFAGGFTLNGEAVYHFYNIDDIESIKKEFIDKFGIRFDNNKGVTIEFSE